MHARFVLQWLTGELDALPLWNAGPGWPQVTEGTECPRSRIEIELIYEWALMARWRYPWPGESGSALAWQGFGWGFGTMQLLNWACGETREGPLAGTHVMSGRPTLYQVALDTRGAMTALLRARDERQITGAGRFEALMETFLWLAGWNSLPPVDRHGHGLFEDCPERDARCACSAAGCVRSDCPACRWVPCVRSFGEEGMPATGTETG